LDKIQESYNSELANGLGNLIARTAALCEKSGFNFPEKNRLIFDPEIANFLEKYQINSAIEKLWQKISETDKLINTREPWKLSGNELKEILTELVIQIRQIALGLQPFLPQTAELITKQFGQEKIITAKPIFPRI
jgi:methionyl-tRNA synthetase